MRLHEYPFGWLEILVEAVIRRNLSFSIHDLSCEDMLTNNLLDASVGENICGIKDHWGDSNGRLVFEPYGNHDDDAKKFADFLKLELVTGNPAEWNSSCTRYEFVVREASNVAQSVAELIRCRNWEFTRRCKAEDALRRLGKTVPPR